jgi:hypothetical protein
MLVGDDVFIKGIRQGIDQGDYVYQSGDLLRGKGDPHAEIKVDEQSFVLYHVVCRGPRHLAATSAHEETCASWRSPDGRHQRPYGAPTAERRPPTKSQEPGVRPKTSSRQR